MTSTLVATQRARDIFHDAIEHYQPPQWPALLDSACQGDDALRCQVERLLAAHGELNSFMGQPAVAVEATTCRVTEQPGTHIGPYKLLEQIGEGGFGVVFMAEQTEPVRRKVALKVLKPGMDTGQVVARFEAERQALAIMDHPNIARVFDGGATPTGRPFFVMELVRGVPITEYCDQNHLTPRQRLELFVTVCHTVQHAHQKGLIHRDLKPSNVLVSRHDTTPIVKIIDFGVAKALGQSLTDKTLFTGIAQMIGTPLYMSPEQAGMSDLDVDTRSDIYSLGVLLYELLTGQTPFDRERLKSVGFDEMRRIIREEEPETVSARIARTKSSRQTPSAVSENRGTRSVPTSYELDWIVMKALEKDRSRRYESASALAADIQRYLSDEPVLACPPTAMYRFQKFARKHKGALTTSAAIAACLILGTTVSAWQAVRATTAEAQAEANEQKAVANEQKANANAAQAQEKAQEANTQRDEAQRQRDEIKALNEQLRRALYASNMNLAKSAWDASNIERVNELLDQYLPKDNESDLRGFEWHYLHRLCHSDLLTLDLGVRIGAIAFSPDGKRLVTSSYDRTLKVWDAGTGGNLLTIKLDSALNSVAFSPDGKRLASATYGYDYNQRQNLPTGLKVWDAETGQELLSIKNGRGTVAFSPDGKRVAARNGAWDDAKQAYVGEVNVWDSHTGEELLSIKGQSESGGVAFSPDGKQLATLSRDNTVKVWNAQNGQQLLSLKNGGEGLVFSTDGKRLAAGVKVWDSETGKELLTLKSDTFSVAISPDGKRLATADRSNTITVLDPETGDQLLTFKGHTQGVNMVVFSSDGNRLASSGRDGTVKIWDATTSQEARTVNGGANRFRSASFSPDGKHLAVATAGTWDAANNTGVNAEVKVLDARTGKELLNWRGHDGAINSVAYSPDGKRLVSASWDKTVKLWDAETGKELLTFNKHSTGVVCVSFSPDGANLVSCSSRPSGLSAAPVAKDPGDPGEVIVWNARTGEEKFTLKGHKGFVNSVAFSPDGKHLATLSRDNTVKVWDAQTGQELRSLTVHAAGNGSVAFSPDGRRLAASSQAPLLVAGTSPFSIQVKVWDFQTSQELFTLKTGGISAVFSPDGKRLITGSGGFGPRSLGEVKVWDAETGQELLALDGRSESPSDIAFSSDGHFLVSKGRDPGSIKIYDATPLPEKR